MRTPFTPRSPFIASPSPSNLPWTAEREAAHVDDEEQEHRLRGSIRAALSVTLFAALLLSLAEAAPYLSMSHAWAPALTFVGSVAGILAAVLTHVAVGSSAFPKAWSLFMPGRGGLRFVALQVVAWTLTVAGMLLPMVPFCMWCLTGQVCCWQPPVGSRIKPTTLV